MTEKRVNYTDEMVARLNEVYDGSADEATRDEQIKALAAELDRSPASIRAKLTSEGLYVPKTKAPAGKATVRKSQLVAAIAAKMKVDEDILGSLEKVNKSVLVRIYNAL